MFVYYTPREGRASRHRHRVPDLVEDFDDEDLEQFAASAERAADNPELDVLDLCELFGAADTAREAATVSRKRRKRRGR